MALSFAPASWVLIYADFGQSFRAPVLSELYESLTLNTGFSNFVPNPGLQDERSNQFEMGTALRKTGLFTKGDGFRFRAAGFYSADRNLIQSAIVGSFKNPFLGSRPIFQAQNVSRAERCGGEFEVEYSSGGWFGRITGSHIISIDRSTGAGLYSPPNKLVGTVYYQFPSPTFRFIGRRLRLSRRITIRSSFEGPAPTAFTMFSYRGIPPASAGFDSTLASPTCLINDTSFTSRQPAFRTYRTSDGT